MRRDLRLSRQADLATTPATRPIFYRFIAIDKKSIISFLLRQIFLFYHIKYYT